MRVPRPGVHWSSLALVIAAAAPTALHAQDPPQPAAHVIQQPSTERAAHARTVLAELVERPVPRGLTERERERWDAQTEWLRSVGLRIARVLEMASDPEPERAAGAAPRTIRRDVDKATPQLAETAGGEEDGTGGGGETVELRLTRLQEAVQQESRRFRTLSNAMKARHEMAMNTIRNMK